MIRYNGGLLFKVYNIITFIFFLINYNFKQVEHSVIRD